MNGAFFTKKTNTFYRREIVVTKKRWKVLMVYPTFPPSFWGFDESVKLLGKRATMAPTGLATVAAMLPAEHFEVLPIVDLRVEMLADEQIQTADIVMFSAMIVQRASLEATMARVKRFGKKIVIGGPYATAYRDQVLAFGAADYLVLDEAETTLGPWVEDFLTGQAERVYDERSVQQRITIGLTREGKPVLTRTPLPRWDLLKLDQYANLAIQFSRGCPYNCEFCDIVVLYGHVPRAKTPAQMLAELEAVYKTGWCGSIFIVDDNFIGNKAEVRLLLPVLARWQREHGYPFSFFTEASMELANENHRDILFGMIAAGFQDIFTGIESTDPAVLKAMRKGQNHGDLGRKVETLQRAGLNVMAGFIVGSDGDQPTAFQDLFCFVQENGIVTAMAGLLTALRGTPLYKRLKLAGRLREETSGNHTHHFKLNFDPEMDEQTLIRGYVWLLEQLYSPQNYYARCLTLRARRGPYRRASRLDRHGILAAIRICCHNLIRRPDKEFAKFLFGTLFRAPRELPVAITEAVKFRHFQVITAAAVAAYHYPERVATLAERFQGQVVALCGDAEKRLRQLTKLEQRFVTEATRLCHSIPRDFRASAEEALGRWLPEFHSLVKRYRQHFLMPALTE